MKSIEQRLKTLEAEAPAVRPSVEDQRGAEDQWFANKGLTREQVIARYGSVPQFAIAQLHGVDHLGELLLERKHALMEANARRKREGRTAHDELLAMLGVGTRGKQ